MSSVKPYVVVPNWNGAKYLPACLDSLLDQTLGANIIVVDNGSTDNSLELLQKNYGGIEVISLSKNQGFAGGVNAGIKKAIAENAEYIALLNNDAVVDKNWTKHLVSFFQDNPKAGIVTSKILDQKKELIDSTGDLYTVWGLPFPRGRGEMVSEKYDKSIWVFAASGGASLYRTKMLEQIGVFDEDFFAYYEDVDLSFRAQLAGWKVGYESKAIAYHQIGATSGKIKGFATYQTFKNLPCLMWKNVPARLMFRIWPRMVFAYYLMWGSAILRGQIFASSKGAVVSILLWPKKLAQRYKIQRSRKVSVGYIDSIITHDLPPNAHKLRQLRRNWWKVLRKI